LRKGDSKRFFSCFLAARSNLFLKSSDTSDISTIRWALRAWRSTRRHTMCGGMTRNPMRLTGTINALSADVQSIVRLNEGPVMRAYKPGCSFQRQSGTRQPD
jgi:hypothetical protein